MANYWNTIKQVEEKEEVMWHIYNLYFFYNYLYKKEYAIF